MTTSPWSPTIVSSWEQELNHLHLGLLAKSMKVIQKLNFFLAKYDKDNK